ncbi:MAG: hypothetical protein AAF390_04635 [Pseudomonadota bacterium]
MKTIAATLALALTATLAVPAQAYTTPRCHAQPARSFDQSAQDSQRFTRPPRNRVERFDRACPNSGLSRAAKIAIVISDESADTSTERRLPQVNPYRHNPSLGEVFGFGDRPARAKARRAPRGRSGLGGLFSR